MLQLRSNSITIETLITSMNLPEKLFITTKKTQTLGDSIDTLIEGRLDEVKESTASVDAIEKKLPIDLIETENTYIILSPVPGIPVKNISVSMESDELTISGETHKAKFVKGETVYKECLWGTFSRSITLPKNIKRAGHKANLKDGILTIILPKVKKKSTKKIPVESYDN